MNDDHINLKKMGIDLDDIDTKILDFLVNDCRMSYAEIAREVHLSRMSVRDRVIRLIDCGIIEKFTLRINSRKIGLKASIFLNIQTNPNQLENVVTELMNHPNIESVYGVTGANALHVHAFLQDISQVEVFLDSMYKIRGINEIEFGIMTRRYKSTRLFT